LSGVLTGGDSDDDGGKKGGRKPAAPKGKSLSSLSDRQKEYYMETDRWPKMDGKMTKDYYEWKQEKLGTGTRGGRDGRRTVRGGRSVFGGGGGGMSRSPLASEGGGSPGGPPLDTGEGQEVTRSPLESQQRNADTSGLFGMDEKDPNVSGDASDNNPFKVQGNEKKAKTPFKSKNKKTNIFGG